MFIFLKDAPASYQKDKKKKTKATKIDIGGLNLDSDNSDDDSDYDPDADDWCDESVDANFYLDDLTDVFGCVTRAQEAVTALNAGGEERVKFLKIIYHLRKVRGYTDDANMDEDSTL